jgi:lipoprotein-releasing system ATP-binding protein
VAIARALVTRPDCVLMDEPTGNLDPGSAAQILGLIETLSAGSAAFVVVTHDPGVAAHMQRTLELVDGHLEERSREPA